MDVILKSSARLVQTQVSPLRVTLSSDMTRKAPPKAETRKPKPSGVEREPDAWERFEATVDKTVKAKEPLKPPLSR